NGPDTAPAKGKEKEYKGLGIDLGNDGVTENDPNDVDDGANRLQNFPVLTSAVIDKDGKLTVKGTLNSVGNDTFDIEFFANDKPDPSGHGEGKTYLGTRTVMIPLGKNDVDFEFTPEGALPADLKCVTATATRKTTNDTSEFSKCVDVQQK